MKAPGCMRFTSELVAYRRAADVRAERPVLSVKVGELVTLEPKMLKRCVNGKSS
ncbi:hypothetical protein D3C81_2234260 [compost metagenome]